MPIQYVGGQGAGRTNPSAALSVNFALTGGLAAVPAAGDLVIVSCVTGSAAGNPAMAVTVPAGYTPLGQLNQSAVTADTSQNVSYKRMGETPDTAVTIPGTTNNAWGECYTIQVFRGVDSVTPMDVAAVSAGGTGTGRPDPGSITPITPGAWPVICGGSAAGTGAALVAPANYTTNAVLPAAGADTTDAMAGAGYRSDWSSGLENPATFTGGTTGANDSWTCYILALRPQDPLVDPNSIETTQTIIRPAKRVNRFTETTAPNLLTTTLAPEVEAAPFVMLGMEDRLGQRARLRPFELAPNLLTSELFRPPFAQADWPPAKKPRVASGFVPPTNLSITTLATPFVQSEWVPASRVLRKSSFEVSTNLLTATVVPFVQHAWSAVPPRVRARSDATTLDLLLTTLLPAETPPFIQQAWPTPRPRPRVTLFVAPPNLLVLDAVIPPAPGDAPIHPLDIGVVHGLEVGPSPSIGGWTTL